jgi:acyl homoserine lactone synthase
LIIVIPVQLHRVAPSRITSTWTSISDREAAMMQLISSVNYGACSEELADMHELRHRIFKQRLGWEVEASGDTEIDEFDALGPCYLLQRSSRGQLTGCVRLLPTTGPTMLGRTFAALLGDDAAPTSPHIWESSRFGLDPNHGGPVASQGIAKATYELFAGMIAFGLSQKLTDIVTVTDERMERILRRASWPLRRLGQPKTIGQLLAVAGYLTVSAEGLARVRAAGQLTGPPLWSPAVLLPE